MEKIKINIIKTDKDICFISDCMATSGYDFTYHRSKIEEFLFDGEKPLSTSYPTWLKIKKYPTKIQCIKQGDIINGRYELKDKEMVSEKLPIVIKIENANDSNSDIRNCFYEYKYDILPDTLEDVECELLFLCEINNYEEPPVFNYSAINRKNWEDKHYIITNKNIEHSLAHKIFMPAPVLASAPCQLSSKEVYDIVRQYIKENIDLSVAKITSDYDFCFTVKKTIPLIEPETITYHNYFARTKKERNKIHYSVKKYDEKEIFQMTHAQSNYQGYTPIKAIEANNEWDLKEKLDTFLNDLITVINKPLKKCPHCNGGYIEEKDSKVK